jgi:hypothetical protein
MIRFKSQALQIIRITYYKASGIGNPPSLLDKQTVTKQNNKVMPYVGKTQRDGFFGSNI